ncbi:hypothetical protein [Holdemania massiliensis]|uniref:hypothetical protein n=1 Tax=Holdemania massiliensis TaxID=1468449 RepID=UPI001F065195|nr:hypothetical protein [Holdemania massiliensis]MCH1942681.1 hypothetical protein [Holdemania massiliensis]
MKLLDCTLRDGGNIPGKGFTVEDTKTIIEGLIRSNITTIEMGNCTGIGSFQKQNIPNTPTDIEYLEAIQPYVNKAEIGMFCLAKNATDENISLAKKYHLNFLRVGANAGDAESAYEGIKRVKAAGLVCRYSLMKAYVLTPEELAEEAVQLEKWGLDEITIMDSAGTMSPEDVKSYVTVMKSKVSIPIGFHGHNNLGLSAANGLVAAENGADVIDCGLLGMARSAGNCATEVITSLFQRNHKLKEVNFLELLAFVDKNVMPIAEKYNYHAPIKPFDLVLGYSGAHSGFTQLFKLTADKYGVNLYQLIMEVSLINRKNPSVELIEEIAQKLVK